MALGKGFGEGFGVGWLISVAKALRLIGDEKRGLTGSARY
jgi:hypothetical protein